jgi:hypothetical protein
MLMSRFTFFTDISGRVTLDAKGNPRVTAAAIVFPSDRVATIANQMPQHLPKWQACSEHDAANAVDLLIEEAVSVGIFSLNKDTDAWRKFWKDAEPLQTAIVKQDRRPAGFIKPANVMAFSLIGGACAVATGHALRVGPKTRIIDYRGRDLIERTIVCDSDIGGTENVEVFRGLWERSDGAQPRLEQAGFKLLTREVRVTTEQQEPLLLLADYAAGISHAALITDPGRIRLPLGNGHAKELLGSLYDSGKLALHSGNFDLKYEDAFGDAVALAKARTAC